jgi:ribosomal protein S2
VPGNDDAIRSCSLVIRAVADGIAAAQTKVTAAELETPPAEPAAAAENGAGEPAAEAEAEAATAEAETGAAE